MGKKKINTLFVENKYFRKIIVLLVLLFALSLFLILYQNTGYVVVKDFELQDSNQTINNDSQNLNSKQEIPLSKLLYNTNELSLSKIQIDDGEYEEVDLGLNESILMEFNFPEINSELKKLGLIIKAKSDSIFNLKIKQNNEYVEVVECQNMMFEDEKIECDILPYLNKTKNMKNQKIELQLTPEQKINLKNSSENNTQTNQKKSLIIFFSEETIDNLASDNSESDLAIDNENLINDNLMENNDDLVNTNLAIESEVPSAQNPADENEENSSETSNGIPANDETINGVFDENSVSDSAENFVINENINEISGENSITENSMDENNSESTSSQEYPIPEKNEINQNEINSNTKIKILFDVVTIFYEINDDANSEYNNESIDKNLINGEIVDDLIDDLVDDLVDDDLNNINNSDENQNASQNIGGGADKNNSAKKEILAQKYDSDYVDFLLTYFPDIEIPTITQKQNFEINFQNKNTIINPDKNSEAEIKFSIKAKDVNAIYLDLNISKFKNGSLKFIDNFCPDLNVGKKIYGNAPTLCNHNGMNYVETPEYSLFIEAGGAQTGGIGEKIVKNFPENSSNENNLIVDYYLPEKYYCEGNSLEEGLNCTIKFKTNDLSKGTYYLTYNYSIGYQNFTGFFEKEPIIISQMEII